MFSICRGARPGTVPRIVNGNLFSSFSSTCRFPAFSVGSSLSLRRFFSTEDSSGNAVQFPNESGNAGSTPEGGDRLVTFGKHKGQTFDQVKNDRGYIKYLEGIEKPSPVMRNLLEYCGKVPKMGSTHQKDVDDTFASGQEREAYKRFKETYKKSSYGGSGNAYGGGGGGGGAGRQGGYNNNGGNGGYNRGGGGGRYNGNSYGGGNSYGNKYGNQGGGGYQNHGGYENRRRGGYQQNKSWGGNQTSFGGSKFPQKSKGEEGPLRASEIIQFGKFKGESFIDVVKQQPAWTSWIIQNTTGADMKTKNSKAMQESDDREVKLTMSQLRFVCFALHTRLTPELFTQKKALKLQAPKDFLKDKVVCVTGASPYSKAQLKVAFEAFGAIWKDAATKQLDYLVLAGSRTMNGDPIESSTKFKKAKQINEEREKLAKAAAEEKTTEVAAEKKSTEANKTSDAKASSEGKASPTEMKDKTTEPESKVNSTETKEKAMREVKTTKAADKTEPIEVVNLVDLFAPFAGKEGVKTVELKVD